MKKTLYLVLSVILACSFLLACGGKNTVLKETDQFIVLMPSDEYSGKTLADFMKDINASGELEYKIENGMVTSINGIDNQESYYWMLYTDDSKNSNESFGTIKYKDKTYASASLGATKLIIAKDCTYIWVYTKL